MSNLLLVIDAQNDFITGALGSEYAASIVPRIVENIRNFNGDILFTLDTHDSNYLKTQEGKMLPISHCIEDTEGWYVNKNILNGFYPMFHKTTFGLDHNRINNIVKMKPDAIHIIGYVTDICVITNALLLKTALPETPIYVDASCCAGTSKAAHDAALTVMRSCQIIIENA